ncbi:hypothetical protein POM88_048304 [Heracleum sosnowskyi]|uniref:NB-ARC domain-containing protein n=1 Tax=Heracleum sosnowskyi TaxID=360622 RepID=A0AAD8GVZ5_9APIA|nr:hypothetical protein POM88_048304 [Heracleum sosnowskyi]
MGNLVSRWCNSGIPREETYSRVESRVDLLFVIWIEQVNVLLEYSYWLPIQRCQISFYSDKLRTSMQAFPSFTLTTHPDSSYLSIIYEKIKEAVSRIDEYKTVRPNVDLNSVGERLALQVAEVYVAYMQVFGKPTDWNSTYPYFASHFYFDKKKFQEQLNDEVFVGFQEEASNLLKKLVSITKKQLQVISIVGMAGLGKTTLARRLYSDPYIVSYFYVRVWVTCSQDYQKRDLLLAILRSVVENADDVCSLNDNMLAQELYRALMGRSLVVGKKGSSGAIKTCCIHDLLRELCLRKAEEENFSQNFEYNKHSYICHHSLTNPSKKSKLLLSTNVPSISSDCSCYSIEVSHSFFRDVPVLWDTSKPIRALNLSSIEFFIFPSELLQVVHLRYLELRFRSGNPPESISHLAELQTLIMSSRVGMVIPNSVWKMIKLEHLCIKSGENLVNFSSAGELRLLENLQTLSLVSPTRQCQQILARARNLLKLGICGPLITKSGNLEIPDLGLLVHLETLKLLNTIPLFKSGRFSDLISFPESLKSLSISNTYLDWREASIFELTPNLEVLKMKLNSFVGIDWETSPEAFHRLKYLKIEELDIVTWTASSNHFPVLQRLQVYRCSNLTEIPEDFGNIYTLECIELSGCSNAATESARVIQKEQESNGNDWLQILLNPGLTPT